MQLLIIRHGESEADILGVHEGRADFPLTERGLRQADAMGSWVAEHYPPTKIYSSTLKRAKQTAAALVEHTKLPVIEDADLMEFNNGLIAGLSREEADKLFPRIPDLPIHEARYEMESQLEFRMRAERMMSKLISENEPDDTVAVVSHGGFIFMLYRAFLGLPINSQTVFNTGDTGIHLWRTDGTSRIVIFSNSTMHVAGI